MTDRDLALLDELAGAIVGRGLGTAARFAVQAPRPRELAGASW